VLLALALLVYAAPGQAQQVNYRLKDTVLKGEDPVFYLQPTEDMDTLQVQLKRSDGKVQRFKHKKVAAGTSLELPIKQPVGQFDYTAEILMLDAGGSQSSVEIKFQATVAVPLSLELDRGGTDLDAGVVSIKVNTLVDRADIVVHGEKGVLVETTQDLKSLKGGQMARLTWSSGEVARKVEVKVHDRAGFWSGFELLRIEVDIPHDEVNFDTGKSTFAREEAEKLDRTLQAIYAELEKYKDYSTQLEINLYIGGYTDTVGDKGANRTLSQQRARAIGAYFRKKGLSVPIYFQGFGEDALAVKTEDNVDEARNRRALYILSNFPPPVSYHLPRKAWKRLP
jgi:outer membrane protein OmpA-like peptidoglycan-associated protein